MSSSRSISAAFNLAPSTANYTALYWNPSESGWGINVSHQGDIVFATLFTYGPTGAPMWLVMSNGARQGTSSTYSGDLYRTTGPVFNAQPFTPISAANLTKVGTMTLTFQENGTASLAYSVNSVPVTKVVERQVFAGRAADCKPTSDGREGARNYQDLWWKADESGWGINIAHQGETLFATLFSYDTDGQGMWLVLSAGLRTFDGSYAGDLYRTKGPAFNAQPFTPIGAGDLTKVGAMRLRFLSGTSATLEYSVDGVTVSKPIVRQVFSSPVPTCS